MRKPDEVFLCYNLKRMNTFLLIDGENFIYKVEDSLIQEGIEKVKIDILHIDLNKLIKLVLPNEKITESNFYSAKLTLNPTTITKSKKLIQDQRILKSTLEKQGFNFILAGTVRAQKVTVNGKSTTIFKEKGVDVRIAVDMVSLSCDDKVDRIVLCSSDSDLQPAISEVRKRGKEVIYLGFESNQNKGLSYSTNRTVLFRNSEIRQTVPILSQKG